MPPPKKPIHIAICGGGLGGLALAIGLLSSPHITFTIYESAPALGEIGAGVGFGANSHKAIQLISPELWDRYRTRATFNGWASKSRTWFDFSVGTGPDEGKRIIEVLMDSDETQSTVHRAHFVEELVKFLPEGVAEMSKRVVSIEQPAGEKVRILFADGTDARADAVVGADGIRSACRAFVVGDSPALLPRFTNTYAYRGLIPMDEAVAELGEEKARNRQMYLGDNGHIITFPVAKGNIMNIVAFHGAEGEWEGPWVKGDQKEGLERDFAGWGAAPSGIIKLLKSPDVWALYEHPPTPTYHNAHVALLGDAAHASTPHFGAGAGMALEDALVLSRLLPLCDGAGDIQRAFRAYDAVRVPRTQAVVRESREQGRVLDMRGEGVGADLDRLREVLDERVRWIWGVDLEEHCREAVRGFWKGGGGCGVMGWMRRCLDIWW
ncbi:hypothetical protein VE03_07258 [Pseudogymnoascus sp. 23342-1-I1]|nr:hypothetical protein VE03_07258 [Pseudogymnoascus sp. 23342-1-I1]